MKEKIRHPLINRLLSDVSHLLIYVSRVDLFLDILDFGFPTLIQWYTVT